jgi:hypothetical protein
MSPTSALAEDEKPITTATTAAPADSTRNMRPPAVLLCETLRSLGTARNRRVAFYKFRFEKILTISSNCGGDAVVLASHQASILVDAPTATNCIARLRAARWLQLNLRITSAVEESWEIGACWSVDVNPAEVCADSVGGPAVRADCS